MQHIVLRNLGPIHKCEMDVGRFTVLTGPQSNGKSTIAKAIFFFRTLGREVYEQIKAKPDEDEYRTSLENDLKKRLRSKFLRTFGSSWSMPKDMKMIYTYSRWVDVEVYLVEDHSANYRNFVDFKFGDKIVEFLQSYKDYETLLRDEAALAKLKAEVQELFGDWEDTIYIPAGRSMITLLSDSLATLSSNEDFRKIDFCTQSYMKKILQLRSEIKDGFSAMLQDKLHMSQTKIDKESLARLMQLMDGVIKGRYSYTSGEERIVMENHRYVKVSFASSGQQEAVWLFNIFYYYVLERKPMFVLVEEPESHLYPDSQKYMAEALGVFVNAGNSMLVTTHSPYILGELNNMLYAGQIKGADERVREVLNPLEHLPAEWTRAFYVHNGGMEEGLKDGLIQNELIDAASDVINQENDRLMQIEWDLQGDEDCGA